MILISFLVLDNFLVGRNNVLKVYYQKEIKKVFFFKIGEGEGRIKLFNVRFY